MLGIIVATIFIAIFVNLILKKLQLPSIIGYIITGTSIAYLFNLHEAVNNHTLREIAEFGVVFLMFTIGLEFSFPALLKMRREVFLTGSLQIFITCMFVYVVCHYILKLDFKTSLIIGAALSLSSTAIVLKTFSETKEIRKPHGRRVVGILIMQDIAVIPILLMISLFTIQGDSNILTIALHTIIAACVLIAVLFISGKYLLEPFFAQVASSKSDELFVASVLFIAIGASYLAYSFGFSYSLGAFIAGMMISETKFKHQVEADLAPFRNILLGIFFITVGMQINFEVIFKYKYYILGLLVVLSVVKYLIIYFIVRIDASKRVAFKTALALIQMGEFSLAVLELARSSSLVDPVYSQILIITIVFSMVLTPLILKNLSHLSIKLISEDPMQTPNALQVDGGMQDHVIVLGFGSLGKEVVRELRKANKEHIIIEHNYKYFDEGKKRGEHILYGNAVHKHILESVKIKKASAVIITTENFEQIHLACKVIADLAPKVKIIVKVNKYLERDVLNSLHLNNIVIQAAEVAKALVKEIDELENMSAISK